MKSSSFETMPGQLPMKRKFEGRTKGRLPKRPVKKFKKQTEYNSDSSDDEAHDVQAVNLQDSDSDDGGALIGRDNSDDENSHRAGTEGSDSEVTGTSESDLESEADSDTKSNPNLARKRKRNDPEAFATSMSKILGSKLSTSKRNDPVLSRSITSSLASKEMIDQTLEKKARGKLREEKRIALDKGRIRDVLGASTAFDFARGEEVAGPSTAEVMETEKRLRKTAQRGVVKLFNAVRAAQVKGQEAEREVRKKGLVGRDRREEKVNEMSKQGFLELIAGGAGGLKSAQLDEI